MPGVGRVSTTSGLGSRWSWRGGRPPELHVFWSGAALCKVVGGKHDALGKEGPPPKRILRRLRIFTACRAGPRCSSKESCFLGHTLASAYSPVHCPVPHIAGCAVPPLCVQKRTGLRPGPAPVFFRWDKWRRCNPFLLTGWNPRKSAPAFSRQVCRRR